MPMPVSHVYRVKAVHLNPPAPMEHSFSFTQLPTKRDLHLAAAQWLHDNVKSSPQYEAELMLKASLMFILAQESMQELPGERMYVTHDVGKMKLDQEGKVFLELHFEKVAIYNNAKEEKNELVATAPSV